MYILETCVNLAESIAIAMLLLQLSGKKSTSAYVKTAILAIIDFVYIQYINVYYGLSEGLYVFFEILIHFIYAISMHVKPAKAFTIATIPDLLLALINGLFYIMISFLFGFYNISLVLSQFRIIILLIMFFIHVIVFYEFSIQFKKLEHIENNKFYLMLSLICIAGIVFLQSYVSMIFNGVTGNLLFLSFLSGMLLCLFIVIISYQTMLEKIEYEKEKNKLMQNSKNEWMNYTIKEKERYLNELSHNVLLFLQLLQTGAKKEKVEQSAKKLTSQIEMIDVSATINNPALSAAIKVIAEEAENKGIHLKITYVLQKIIDVDETDLYLVLTQLLMKAISFCSMNTEMAIEIKEVMGNCKISVTYHGGNKCEIGDELIKLIKKNNGDVLVKMMERRTVIRVVLPVRNNEN